MRRQLRIAGIVAAVLPLIAAAPSGLPTGWREPTDAEVQRARETATAYYDFAKRYRGPRYAISADFDGDGRKDRAAVLLNDTENRFALFVRLAKDRRYREVSDGDDLESLWDWRLSLIPPGVYKPACARGLGDDQEPCRKTVKVRWPAINWGPTETANAIYFWDGQRFDQEYLWD